MQSKIVTITAPTATGSVGYTGVGFQPKVIIVIGGKSGTTLGDAAAAQNLMGAAVAGPSMVCVNGQSSDAAATSAAGSGRSVGSLIIYRNQAGTINHNGVFVSMDSDGFTINWTAATGTQRMYFVLCLGGSDVQAAVGTFTCGASTGNRSVTGLSFQPNCLIFIDSRVSTTATGAEVYWGPMVGFVDSAGNQGAYAGESWDGQAAASVTSRIQNSTAACIIGTTDSGGVADKVGSFVSYNSDGFTVNFSTLTANGINTVNTYIALQVPFAQVGTVNTRTTTGTTDVATTGFTPKALFVGGCKRSTGGNASADHFFSIGMATSVSERGYITHADQNGAATSNASTGSNNNAILRWITANSATPTTDVLADVTDMSYQNFRLNYTTVEASARAIIYLAIGDAPAASGARSFAAIV